VAGNHNNEDLPPGRVPNPGQPGAHYRVVVLDKQDGSIKHMKNYQQGSMFQWVNQDKSGAIEFGSYNLRVRITPDQSAKK
jgi:hypothetical protein